MAAIIDTDYTTLHGFTFLCPTGWYRCAAFERCEIFLSPSGLQSQPGYRGQLARRQICKLYGRGQWWTLSSPLSMSDCCKAAHQEQRGYPVGAVRAIRDGPDPLWAIVYLNYTYYINILEDAYGC